MWIASEAPERVGRLALCCTAPRFGQPEQWVQRARTVRYNGVEAIAEAALTRWFTPRFRAERPDVVGRGRLMLQSTPAEGYAGCCEAIQTTDLRGRLKAITAPTLVLAGSNDPAASVEQAELLYNSIFDAQLVVVEKAAHLANMEQPETVTQKLLEHLSS